ncbi:MAG: methyltransferase domain-containing protein [bacterium]|nr:methyltransferase domain-containing protein [bacterium]
MPHIQGAPLPEYQVNFLEQELLPRTLAGKRLLEVGAGHGELCRYLPTRVPEIQEVIGINVEDTAPQEGEKWKLLPMDARRLEFPDASFDLAYSLATFEHIHDLPAALAEMWRVLRPGGLLVTVWSPIWNGFNGHHYGSTLSHPDHRDVDLPWAHLLFNARELPGYLTSAEGFAPQEARQAVVFIYESPWLNRLCYGDYVSILEASPFDRVQIEGVRVELPGLLSRVNARMSSGHLRPEQLISFFKRTCESEIMVYKIKAVLQR